MKVADVLSSKIKRKSRKPSVLVVSNREVATSNTVGNDSKHIISTYTKTPKGAGCFLGAVLSNRKPTKKQPAPLGVLVSTGLAQKGPWRPVAKSDLKEQP